MKVYLVCIYLSWSSLNFPKITCFCSINVFTELDSYFLLVFFKKRKHILLKLFCFFYCINYKFRSEHERITLLWISLLFDHLYCIFTLTVQPAHFFIRSCRNSSLHGPRSGEERTVRETCGCVGLRSHPLHPPVGVPPILWHQGPIVWSHLQRQIQGQEFDHRPTESFRTPKMHHLLVLKETDAITCCLVYFNRFLNIRLPT